MVIGINLLWIFIIVILVIFLTRKNKDSTLKESDEKINALRSEWSNTLSKNTDLILKQLNENAKILQSVN